MADGFWLLLSYSSIEQTGAKSEAEQQRNENSSPHVSRGENPNCRSNDNADQNHRPAFDKFSDRIVIKLK